MLVLSRKPGEEIILKRGNEVLGQIVPIRIGPNSVRLGFRMASDIEVIREELETRWEITAAGEESQSDPAQPVAATAD